ncbi:MAG: ParB/RepB/Spo0J family partition protein, partial [Bdellovibrionota bacterium]
DDSPPPIAPAAVAPAPIQATRPVIADEAQIWMIPIDRLTPNTQQPRQVFVAEALKELTASIKEKGILMPIVARRLSEGQFEIIAGERRWRAAQAAGLHEVPVILRKAPEQDSLELAIIENIQRENLNAMEEAEAFEHLMGEYGLTQGQVAEKLGKERSSIANTLRLLTLPPEVKSLVRNNELSPGHAKVILGAEGTATQIELAKQVVTENLSVRATEKLVARAKTEARSRAPGAASQSLNLDVSQRLIEGLGAELQKLIGTKVSIDYSDSKGKLSIHFYSDDQLTQVVEKIRAAWEK